MIRDLDPRTKEEIHPRRLLLKPRLKRFLVALVPSEAEPSERSRVARVRGAPGCLFCRIGTSLEGGGGSQVQELLAVVRDPGEVVKETGGGLLRSIT